MATFKKSQVAVLKGDAEIAIASSVAEFDNSRMNSGHKSEFLKPYSLRDVITRRMDEQGITSYRLAKQLHGVVPQRTLYNYLAGGEIKSRYLDAILNVLFIRFEFRTMTGRRPRSPVKWVIREWDRQKADSLHLNRYYDRHLNGTSRAMKEIQAATHEARPSAGKERS